MASTTLSIRVEIPEEIDAHDRRDMVEAIREELLSSFGPEARERLGYEGPFVVAVNGHGSRPA